MKRTVVCPIVLIFVVCGLHVPLEAQVNSISRVPKLSAYLTIGMINGFDVESTSKPGTNHAGGDYSMKTGLSIGAGGDFRVLGPISVGVAVDQGGLKTHVFNAFGSRIDITQSFGQGSLMATVLVPLVPNSTFVRTGIGIGFGYLGEILFEGTTNLATITASLELLTRPFLIQGELVHVISGSNDYWDVSTDDILILRVGITPML